MVTLMFITKKGRLASVLFGQYGERGFSSLFRDFGSVLGKMLWRPEYFGQNSEFSSNSFEKK